MTQAQSGSELDRSEIDRGSPYGTLGMFDFDEIGRLSPNLPEASMEMQFCWRGRQVNAALRAEDNGTGVMVFSTLVGRVPSSAIAAAARPDAFELLRCLPGILPRHWNLTVGADHSVQLQTELPVAMPALISDILVPTVQFCLTAAPLLDLLEENVMGVRS